MSTIEHRPEERRFVLSLDDGLGYLAYQLDDNDITFTSTFVPDNWRGRGLARELVDAGLAWARDQGYRIHASCSYVQVVLKRGG
ncbi:N-acetyltransferase [bacterium]|nr:N-acetyltransferase [bacterium]